MAVKVDVLVPTYNQASTLPATLDSLLQQRQKDLQIVVSDDASTDQTREVLKRYEAQGIRVLFQAQQSGNLFRHWNRLIQNSQAEYVALYHSDDVYHPDIVSQEVGFLDRYPEIDAVFTEARAIDARGIFLWDLRAPSHLKRPILDQHEVYRAIMTGGNAFLICPSVMYRRSLFERLGEFDESLEQSADLEMWLRILFRGKGVGLISRPLMDVRFSKTQASSRYERYRESLSDFFQVMDSYLDQAQFSSEDLRLYESLKQLDRLHIGLQWLAAGKGSEKFQEALQWFEDPKHRFYKNALGGVDRLKVSSARALKKFPKPLPKQLAHWVLRGTNPISNPALKLALQLKRRWVDL